MSRTTRKTYSAKLKMAVAIDVVRGEKTLSQVAAEHGVSPSLASEWRDELLGGADDVFGRRKQDRERREQEAAARRDYDEALRTIGQLTVERDFLRRFCEDNGYDPEEAGRGRWAAGGALPLPRLRAARGEPRHRVPRHGQDGARRRGAGEARATRWRGSGRRT